MQYVIHSKSERGFWHNLHGWVYALKDATVFKHTNYPLPISVDNDAEWMPVKYSED